MPEVSWQVRDEGTAQLIQKFQQLTKAEQRAAVEASKIGGELTKLGRKKSALDGVGKAALGIAASLGAVVSVSGAITAGFAEVRRQIQETINLAKEAQALGRNIDNARGNILANDPNLNKADRAKIDAAIRNVAPQLGGAGAQQAGKIFADIRTGTAGASLDQQIGAFRTAVRGTALTGVDDLSSLAPQAVANVKIQQALAASGQESSGTIANNLLVAGGSRAGIDTGDFGRQLNPLINIPGSTVQNKASLLAFGTAETGLPGERISTGVGSLLNRLNKPNLKDAATGTTVSLQGETLDAKLDNFLDQIQGGELDQGAGLRAIAADDSTKTLILQALIAKRGEFNKTRDIIGGSAAGDALGTQISTQLAESPGLASTLRTRTAEGTAAIRGATDFQGRSAMDVAASITASRKGLGITTPMMEMVPLMGLEKRAISASKKPGGLLEFEEDQKFFDLKRAFNVTPDQQVAVGASGGASVQDFTRINALRNRFSAGGESAFFRGAIQEGFVSPDDGVSVAERTALSSVGIPDEQLNKLAAVFQEGNTQMFSKIFAEVMAEARTLIADGNIGPKKSDVEN